MTEFGSDVGSNDSDVEDNDLNEYDINGTEKLEEEEFSDSDTERAFKISGEEVKTEAPRSHQEQTTRLIGVKELAQSSLINASVALKVYFKQRLERVVGSLGGDPGDLQDWQVQVLRRDGGLAMGLLEIEYVNNNARKFRSRVEVACSLGLMPSARNIRSMARGQLYLCAVETRERHLISQHLGMMDYVANDIHFDGDLVSVGANRAIEGTKAAPDGRCGVFSFGNISVLDWGRIIQDAAFHTSSQLFPLGFRCVRQEHDVVLDRVVDCLCEIDAVRDTTNHDTNRLCLERRALLPLFRITVSWVLSDNSRALRVYEARTPQQAWQAAMLERVGLDPEGEEEVGFANSLPLHEEEEDSLLFEAPDDEETTMRAEIREQRRQYYRALRCEQSLGVQAAVKPRLSIEAVDSFGDELLLRLVEGMEGSEACQSYHFLDSREREAGKKSMLRAYSRMFAKAKHLDKVMCRAAAAGGGGGGPSAVLTLGARKRRPDENDSRKRVKTEENKELRTLTAAFLKNRGVRLREVEKGITLLKAAMVRNVKKRREDAKIVVEALSDREESARAALTVAADSSIFTDDGEMLRARIVELSAIRRPEPCGGPMLLDGAAAGSALEVWEFLSTFAQSLHVPQSGDLPSVQQLLGAVKSRDPSLRAVSSYSKSLQHSFECASSAKHNSSFLIEMTPSVASEILNRVGMQLSGVLRKDFERAMGLDQVEAQAGDLRVPLNELTWREMARVVLVSSLCRDVGMGDADISTLLRGRGFYTTPESADRKALKLARRRISFGYTIRDEYQESLFGFGSGHCVRLPAPAVPFRSDEVVWTELVSSLAQVPDHQGWLIHEMIRAAAVAASAVDTSMAARRLQKALRECLDPSIFRPEDGRAAKLAALSILSSQFYRKQNSPVLSEASAGDAMNSAGSLPSDRLRLVYDFSPDSTPLSTLDLWAKRAKEAVRNARPLLCDEKADVVTKESDVLAEEEKTKMEEDEEVFREGEAIEVDAPPSGNLETSEKEGGDDEISPLVEPNERIAGEEGDEEDEVEWIAAPIEADFAQAELLSVAMQRCYLVLRDLMTHQHARYFLRVDEEETLASAQALSLSDIRAFLVAGGYADSIFALHCDVTLLLENAMALHLELSPGRVAAQKLLIVFERLFFETVMCWDHPLPFHDSCHVCRSAHPISSNKKAVCDRCEGSYHLQCLSPPLFAPPRSEWYCLPCVEQRGIANAHPYKTADVAHPSDPEALGEVVGIEQLQETVLFVVEFGTLREMWTGSKVRQYAIDASSRDLGHNASSPKSRQPLRLQLPSGYHIEDYDRVCGVARAYTGWGASRNLVPAALLDAHSRAAQDKSSCDDMFDKFRRAAAVLAAAGSNCLNEEVTGATEWALVLRSLLQRALASPQVTGLVALLDESVDEAVATRLLARVRSGCASLAELQDLLDADATRGSLLSRLGAAQLHDEVASEEEDSHGNSSDDEVHLFRRGAGQRVRPMRIVEDEEVQFDSEEEEEDDASSAEEEEEEEEEGGRHVEHQQEQQEQDSDDEDMFDAQGRCLTSGVSEVVRRDEEEEMEDWEMRQLSRQKGREDALLTQVLVAEVLGGLDVEGRNEEAEEGYDLVRVELGSFYRGAANCIVKACMGRPSESLVIDDWCVGWQHKMESLLRDHRVQVERSDASIAVCELCGSEESFLGSPFVRGFTLHEYEADLAADRGTICDGDSESGETNVIPAVSSSFGTGIKGFRSRNKALNGLVWAPVDEQDAETETRECARIQRPIKSGSLVVHECCADFLHFSRRLSQGRSQNTENNHIVEVLAGMGRAKASPLGVDRFGHSYWVFAGSSALFVSSSGDSGSRGSGHVTEPADSEMAKTNVWRVYPSTAEVGSLLRWLDERLPSERILKRTMSLLFPEAVNADVADSMPEEDPSFVAMSGLSEVTVSEESHLTVSCASDGDEIDKEDEEDDDEVNFTIAAVEEEEEEDSGTEEELGPDPQIRKSQRPQRKELRSDIRFDQSRRAPRSLTGSIRPTLLRRGEIVLVETSPLNRILWEARVLESRVASNGTVWYKMHFLQWDVSYDGWYDAEQVVTASEAVTTVRGSLSGGTLRVLMQESRAEYLRKRVLEAPLLLQSLTAFQFMDELNRACGPNRVGLTFSDASSSDIALLRSAMLMVEMALPLGAVDDAEDRWGDNFVLAWRQAVIACSDATGLMQCQIMLEYGVRTAWLKPAGLKLFSCMPSRALCMRSPSVGLVAMRLWLLDLTVRYDKVTAGAEKAASTKGRPSSGKALGTSSSKSSGRSKVVKGN